MEYPDRDKVQKLSARLNGKYGSNYMIYNMSEHAYDTGYFQGQVTDIRFRGLPSPPLELFFKLLVSVRQWLDTGCFSRFCESYACSG